MSRIDRLQLLLDRFADGEQTKLALLIGKSRQQISHWFTGYRPIGEQIARDIEIALKLPRGWLDDDVELPINHSRRLKETDSDDLTILQYDAGGDMGHGLILEEKQPGIIKSWKVDHEWLRLNVRHHTGVNNLCIVTGFGPSMQPKYNPGDPLLLDQGVTSVESEGIYFFRVGKHGFIKQLQRIPTEDGMIIRAKSLNSTYDPFDISAKMDFQVFGKVLTVWKSEQV